MNLYKLHTKPKKLLGYDKKRSKLYPILKMIDSLRNTNDPDEKNAWAEDIVNSIQDNKLEGHKEIENYILGLKTKGSYLMVLYAILLGKRWKKAEKYIKKNKQDRTDYKEFGFEPI